MGGTRQAVTGEERIQTTRPASRGQLKQAKRVRKKEKARQDNQVKNRERVRKGQAQKADPGLEIKKSIWEKLAEDRTYAMLREIGDTTKNIDKFQRKRMLMATFLALMGIPAGMFIHVWLYLAGPIMGVVFYKMQLKRVETYYKMWKFERQLNFSKFTRLVIPYLKASGGNTALYTIFNKILKRTEDESDRQSLYQLMGEMGDNPQDLKPFTDYAERSSGTDMSHLFMSTIFDFQQSTFDTQVIDELGRMAAEDMMNAIDEIINLKLKRFAMFPTKVVMSSFILVIGLGAGLMIENFKGINLGGDMLEPESAVEASMDESASDPDVTLPVSDEDEATEDEAESVDATDDADDASIAWEDWKAGIAEVAADSSLTPAEKADIVEGEASKRDLSRDEWIAFEEALRSNYEGYKTNLTDESFVLESLFQARAVSQAYVGDADNPMAIVAANFGRSLYEVYANDEPANSPVVMDYERQIDEALLVIQADIEAATQDATE